MLVLQDEANSKMFLNLQGLRKVSECLVQTKIQGTVCLVQLPTLMSRFDKYKVDPII